MFPAWHLVATDAASRSRGKDVLWDPRLASIHTFSFFGGIILTSFFRGFGHMTNLINLYTPNHDWSSFWRRMEKTVMLSLDSLIIVGDFNYTLCARETWGIKGRFDPLENFLWNLIGESNLIDIFFEKEGLTWLNGQKRVKLIGK